MTAASASAVATSRLRTQKRRTARATAAAASSFAAAWRTFDPTTALTRRRRSRARCATTPAHARRRSHGCWRHLRRAAERPARAQSAAAVTCAQGVCDFPPRFFCRPPSAPQVKLLPGSTEAWDSLGKVFWKKARPARTGRTAACRRTARRRCRQGDLAAARNCFRSALEAGRTASTLQLLSMLLRSMAQQGGAAGAAGAEAPAELVAQSIAAATEAIALDVTSSASWCAPRAPSEPRARAAAPSREASPLLRHRTCLHRRYNLGMGHLAHFFVHRASDGARLQSALKAFVNAEKRGDGAVGCAARISRLGFVCVCVQRCIVARRRS